jgi:hypothetical protein
MQSQTARSTVGQIPVLRRSGTDGMSGQRNTVCARKCGCSFFGDIQQQLEMLHSDPLPGDE